ncbi:MAG TPA: sialidase family protein [Candidatus Dormibacteraeota bacterium]|nr:sialidase family protein [Candidatus Dormibacteraeota bacterium]
MRRWLSTLGALLAAGAVTVSASAPSVGTIVNVTNSQFAGNEESLGMDASGTLLAAAWNDWHFNDGCGFSYSTDGGTTWAPESFAPFTSFTNDPDIPGAGVYPIAGDPVVVWNPKFNTFDVVCQAFGLSAHQVNLLATTFDPAQANAGANQNFSYGSQVGGAPAWTGLVSITTGTSNGSQKGSNGKFPDHEAGTVDTGSGPGHHFGRVYIAWAEFSGAGRSPIDLAYSDDNGRTWTGPIRVSDAGHQFDQDATPRVGPDGSVYVSFSNGPNEKSLNNNAALIAKSTDGGNTWSQSFTASAIPNPAVGIPNALYRGGGDVTSTVDQRTGNVVVVFDDRSTGTGNVYAVHTLAPGNVSAWSAPVRIKPTGSTQFFPWLSSAPNGRVDLVYYDRACDPNDVLICVTLSSTSDDGATWSNVAITTSGFDGNKFQACVQFVEPPNCGTVFIGDYIAVASTNRKAQAMWTGNGPQALDVFTTKVSF